MPASGMTAYSCTKQFASFLAEGLKYELSGKVDCLALEPAQVATKMLGEEANGMDIQTPQAVVKAMFKDLGRQARTYGVW